LIGVKYPCTIIQRNAHWFLPDFNIWGVIAGFLFLNRFAELSVHKPGEPFFLGLLATLLSPLVTFNDILFIQFFTISLLQQKKKK